MIVGHRRLDAVIISERCVDNPTHEQYVHAKIRSPFTAAWALGEEKPKVPRTVSSERVSFALLGPVEVRIDGRSLPLGGPKQQALLACLLLHPNEVVGSEHIVASLWYRPPKTAATIVHIYMSRLRRMFIVGAGESVAQLVTQPGGYLLQADLECIDINRFEGLVRQGSELLELECARAARDRFQQALDLWRGPPLSGLGNEPVGVGARVQLEGLRMAAIEDRVEADLALGRHAEIVPELLGLNSEHPLREGIASKLMLALYRSGRQTEALQVYERVRRTLVDDLGLQPGTALQRLQRAILTHDSGIESPMLDRKPAAAVDSWITAHDGRAKSTPHDS